MFLLFTKYNTEFSSGH